MGCAVLGNRGVTIDISFDSISIIAFQFRIFRFDYAMFLIILIIHKLNNMGFNKNFFNRS